LNLVSVLEFEQLENRYDGNTAHHWNLVCLNCHKIFDLSPVQTIDKEQIEKTTRFEVIRSRFELYGLCHTCSREAKKHSAKGEKQIRVVSSRREGKG
jgi:Fur family peroxide stress response transcriptional regulator